MSVRYCLVCGAKYEPSAFPGLLRCGSCSFITADVSLSREEVEGLYTSRYFAGEEYKNYVSERPLIEKNCRGRVKTLLKYAPEPRTKHLFEIGSAYGFFLSVAQHSFGSVSGVDISADAARYAQEVLGLNVWSGEFSDYQFQQRPDIVCLWDTIEHLQYPDLYLQKIARHITPGGLIALTTGDIESAVARWRGKRWRQIHPPTHLHYFSRATLSKLLAKYHFRVRYCRYEGMRRTLDTMAYMVLVLRHNRPALYRALKRTGVLDWCIYVNLYDILFIIAEKQ